MDGILNVYKPAGITSYDVIRHIKKVIRTTGTPQTGKKIKIGHAGTLDPFAEGVLLVLLGKATKLSSDLMGLSKVYQGTIVLGEERDTDDWTGKVTKAGKAVEAGRDACGLNFSLGQLQAIADSFTGDIEQVPPVYSALHWGGRRLYDLARAGEAVRPPARKVRVDEFKIAGIDKAGFALTFQAKVGKGCYIRALARDFGRALGAGAYLGSLTRVSVGPFLSNEALRLENIAPGILENCLLDYSSLN